MGQITPGELVHPPRDAVHAEEECLASGGRARDGERAETLGEPGLSND